MKTCIWCLNKEGDNVNINDKFIKISFDKESHILPQSLKSKETCIDVCDTCNEFFGERTGSLEPSIDIALKEIFIFTKYHSLGSMVSVQDNQGKEKAKRLFGRYFSRNIIQTLNKNTELLNIDIRNGKKRYKETKAFWHHYKKPEILTNRIKRGIYKVAFEQAYKENALSLSFYDSYYDYVRDFVRWNKGNPEIFYFQRKDGVELARIEFMVNPKVILQKIKNHHLIFDILGHNFGIPIEKSNSTGLDFLDEYKKQDSLFNLIKICSFLDIDILNTVFRKYRD